MFLFYAVKSDDEQKPKILYPAHAKNMATKKPPLKPEKLFLERRPLKKLKIPRTNR
jgi:hypothetical protein